MKFALYEEFYPINIDERYHCAVNDEGETLCGLFLPRLRYLQPGDELGYASWSAERFAVCSTCAHRSAYRDMCEERNMEPKKLAAWSSRVKPALFSPKDGQSEDSLVHLVAPFLDEQGLSLCHMEISETHEYATKITQRFIDNLCQGCFKEANLREDEWGFKKEDVY